MVPNTDGGSPEREQLRTELRALCRSWGVQTANLTIGPAARARLAAIGVPPERSALVEWIHNGLKSLPVEQQTAASAGLALHPAVESDRFLDQRMDWLGRSINRDTRTARRRLDEALERLAEALATEPDPPSAPPDADWFLRAVRTLVVLDQGAPEVIEERTFVAVVDGLDSVTVAMSVPHRGEAGPPDIDAQVLSGARLLGKNRPYPSHVEFILKLPRALAANERHRLVLRYRLGAGQHMTPRYALTPFNRCDTFELRVRFGEPVPTVWRLSGLPPRTLDDDLSDLESLVSDPVGEVYVQFTGLERGRSYGLRWAEIPSGN